ncbi:MAG: putative hydrolase [Methanomassiliicoccales archaeon PtaU1.Bin124]|nr:MAG: putative hydrolase [Methanomassiliicoccales archaeon PtaU1.Bin124]
MKADLHIHSIHSPDGSNEVKDIIRILRSQGINGAAFTDHNSVEGGREALGLKEKDFLVIPGVEVSTIEGHIIALNVTEPIERNLSVIETIHRIHGLGGIAVAAHPYRFWSGLGEENIIGQPFDAVEVLNGRSNDRGNAKAVKLARDLKAPVTAGSDSHENMTLGDAFTVFPEGTETIDQAIQAILHHQTKTGGRSRNVSHTVKYVTKSVSEWIGRGMRRM